MKKISVLQSTEVLRNLRLQTNSYWPQYYAFYSSWYGGILKDPGPLLMVPMDDHLVHRGDGVFEALKSNQRKVYLLESHLRRLQISAERLGLPLPYTLEELRQIILQTLKVADQSQALIRVFLSRGPGGFTVNPYDAVGSQLYVVITQLSSPAVEKYDRGVRVGRSQIPVKEGSMAQIKSCNYLPNVMMKKEAVDRKLDFTVSFDRQGCLAESATENMLIVNTEGVLTCPPLDQILKGTTMTRVLELAAQAGLKTAMRPISEQDLIAAQEVVLTGTTLDVLPVVEYEGQTIADGKVGRIARQLQTLLEQDFLQGTEF